jgi:hypothetical protein
LEEQKKKKKNTTTTTSAGLVFSPSFILTRVLCFLSLSLSLSAPERREEEKNFWRDCSRTRLKNSLLRL